jgi:predicted molibdopterin-dependent oxidoreductase YjgC
LLGLGVSVLRVMINGVSVEQRDGCSVLQALRSTGTLVPALCRDDRMLHPEHAERAWFR